MKTLKYSEQDKQRALEESSLMRKFRHEKIVKLYCVCEDGEPFYIVMEYMCNGSLLKWMRDGDGAKLHFNEIINIATQIAYGMKYLAMHNYVHRDLAARNILVAQNFNVKIADFGLCVNTNASRSIQSTEKVLLAIKWTAPELYTESDHKESSSITNCTSKADVWSYGIVLYELITLGVEPYKDMPNPEVMIRVKYDQYKMAKPGGLCTDDYYKIMVKCWSLDPAERYSFDELYKVFNDYLVEYEIL